VQAATATPVPPTNTPIPGATNTPIGTVVPATQAPTNTTVPGATQVATQVPTNTPGLVATQTTVAGQATSTPPAGATSTAAAISTTVVIPPAPTSVTGVATNTPVVETLPVSGPPPGGGIPAPPEVLPPTGVTPDNLLLFMLVMGLSALSLTVGVYLRRRRQPESASTE
jgi:hypothetical protein